MNGSGYGVPLKPFLHYSQAHLAFTVSPSPNGDSVAFGPANEAARVFVSSPLGQECIQHVVSGIKADTHGLRYAKVRHPTQPPLRPGFIDAKGLAALWCKWLAIALPHALITCEAIYCD